MTARSETELYNYLQPATRYRMSGKLKIGFNSTACRKAKPAPLPANGEGANY